MGLFSDIEKMGFGGVNLDDVFQEEQKPVKKPEVKKEPVKVVLKEEDVLFDKTIQCPVCDNQYKVKMVRAGKLKLVDQDDDLRPIFENKIDALKYDAVCCPRCGYAALSKNMVALTNAQLRTIKQEYCMNFKGLPEEKECMSYEGALIRHKLALVCGLKRNAKHSERAYIFLKMAWLLRGKAEYMSEVLAKKDEIEQIKKEEMECLQKAYEGFTSAMSRENFPMCGMDEITIRYTLAALAHKLGKVEESVRMLAAVLSSKSASQRVKDKALDLKKQIQLEVMDGKK